jgi:hypothetical protein
MSSHKSKNSSRYDKKSLYKAPVMLWLPSSIPDALRKSTCVDGLSKKEMTLRIAQAEDSLHDIRRAIRAYTGFMLDKKKNINGPGQRTMTKTHATIKNLRATINRHAARYRRAYIALRALDPDGVYDNGRWMQRLKELKASDLRSQSADYGDDIDLQYPDGSSADSDASTAPSIRHGRKKKQKVSEGRKEMSWIWRTQTMDARDVPNLSEDATLEEIYERQSVCLILSIY